MGRAVVGDAPVWRRAVIAATVRAGAAAVGRAAEGASFLHVPGSPVLLVVPEKADRPPPVALALALPDAPGPDRRGRPHLGLLNAEGVVAAEVVAVGDDGAAAPASQVKALAAVVAGLAAHGCGAVNGRPWTGSALGG